jgi:hypothetical protein
MKNSSPSIFRVGVVGVPYNASSKGKNIEKGSEALRKVGIVEKLKEFGEVEVFWRLKRCAAGCGLQKPETAEPESSRNLMCSPS